MNSLVTMPGPGGGWVWDGTQWVCGPCGGGEQPCPPGPWYPPPAGQPPWYPGANGSVSFSPPGSPPPNPIRGALWWDGAILWLFDGAEWADTSGGGGNTALGTAPPANPSPGQQWFNGSQLFVWDGNAWVPTSSTKSYVQATAPPSPNPGDTWYDGTQYRIWDGSAWDLVGPGATVGPVPTTTKVFTMIAGTVNLGVSGANVIVPFTTTPTIDTENGWDSVTKKYMPQKAGNYMFFTRTYIGGPAEEAYGTDFLLWNDSGTFQQNAQYYVISVGAYVSAGNTDYLNASGLVHMNGTTDFVRLWSNRPDGTLYSLAPSVPMIEAWLMP